MAKRLEFWLRDRRQRWACEACGLLHTSGERPCRRCGGRVVDRARWKPRTEGSK